MKWKKYKALSICLMLCMTMFPATAFAETYTDIAEHRDEQYIVGYSDLGLVNGYPDGTFRPDAPITRAEVTSLLGKLKLPATNQKQAEFTDVSSADWFYGTVEDAVKSGLVSGYEDNSFLPQKNITRFEAISILSKLVRSEDRNSVQLPYLDSEAIPSWVNSAVRNLYTAGVIGEYGNNRIDGNAQISRSEMVKMLYKVMEHSQFSTEALMQAMGSIAVFPEAVSVEIPHDILGYLTIESIGINEFPIKDGADLETIKTAIGHFAETPLWDGNVSFCAHNRDYKYDFRNLKNIEEGDEIVYKTRFGTRTYQVSVIKAIAETDWTDIVSHSEVNQVTLMTCIEEEPTKRLLVQAVQK